MGFDVGCIKGFFQVVIEGKVEVVVLRRIDDDEALLQPWWSFFFTACILCVVCRVGWLWRMWSFSMITVGAFIGISV
jgi:hypothetical protein